MKKKILIIDDDTVLCEGLAEVLRDEGYDVDSTSDSREGAGLIQKNNYDACLLDYKMAGYDGIDLLRKIKQRDEKCRVFIISGRPEVEQHFEDNKVAGLVAGFVNKPFDIDGLLKMIK